ncbi:MAG: hypothetical protein WCV92_04145 [Candidatus Buchananbacteria bacterium]
MLIVDKEINSRANSEFETETDFDERNFRNHRKPKNHSCAKAFGCFIIFLIIIIGIIFVAIKFFIGPIVMAVDKLPNDFPKELVIYNSENAKIKIQTPAEKKQLDNILKYVPDSISSLFLNFFSTDPRTQFVQKASNNLKLPENINIGELKNYLSNSDLKNSKTVSASWTDIDRKKEDVAEFYRKQFINKGFQFKENIQDYDINLSFWKNDVFGIINISDSLTKTSSDANITVNYNEKQ